MNVSRDTDLCRKKYLEILTRVVIHFVSFFLIARQSKKKPIPAALNHRVARQDLTEERILVDTFSDKCRGREGKQRNGVFPNPLTSPSRVSTGERCR